ncbi:MAG: 2-phospho-L-lactate transferase CofD family protein, partial [Firmicutes bacterium]|nr:2-phospho-L-lactate transferase CofD family protein [Bacillota bacterium]
ALAAIREADAIVLGPGSLYTSIIPNLLVPQVAEAIRQSPAVKIYVCNVMTEAGETPGYCADDHLQALVAHGGQGITDYCLVNTEPIPPEVVERYRQEGAEPVEETLAAIREADAIVLGPGSLYTSIIPNLLVPQVAEAIRQSPAVK